MDGKLKIIIGLLIKKTKAKELSWSQLDENAYSVNFLNNKIIINNYFISFREKRKINFLILNAKNEVVTSISEDGDKDLKELYKFANNNYYNLDATMDDIILALM
ncbi:hypothetical protein J5U18_11885 [Sphingobacteriaceae bacterium WQ 2009]|uniref:Uncharacterized protein n=1 Tax=Rhinopithecimicrobium faecis TaxID=2820698 RepID=A0A8T4HD71_9SPHI|nr:hypothetical protein [Sphingobacteriaceae bacterium WQ 2009]